MYTALTRVAVGLLGTVILLMSGCAAPGASHHAAGGSHAHGGGGQHARSGSHEREPVTMPAELRREFLANMRNHVKALAEIQGALAEEEYARAGDIAEQRLGLTAMNRHGSASLAERMPEPMAEMGLAMHRSATEFAVVAQDSSATGDAQEPLRRLAGVTRDCIACHSAYRVRGGPVERGGKGQ